MPWALPASSPHHSAAQHMHNHQCYQLLAVTVDNLVLTGNNKQFLACLKYSENPLLPHVTQAQSSVSRSFLTEVHFVLQG